MIDQAIADGLTLLHKDEGLTAQPERWTPGGVTTPFFYEDGRRGYIAVPSIRPGSAKPDVTINGLLDNISLLYPKLHAAANPKAQLFAASASPAPTWKALIDRWQENKNEKEALGKLTGQLTGCFGLSFEAFYHPYVCKMKSVLAQGGFEGLMKLSPIDPRPNGSRVDEFEVLYGPVPSTVLSPYPAETAGFSFGRRDGYASYNWEVFYHLPSLVSQKMVADQQYEQSLRWFHFVFNPTGSDAVLDGETSGSSSRGKYWITKPFRQRNDADNPFDMESYVGQRIETILQLLNDPDNATLGDNWKLEVDEWRKHPFVPHQIARGRTVAFQKATVMRYLDALIGWGDFLFRQDGRENVNAALQLYVTAERLLGPRPRVVEAPGGFRTQTYRELEALILGERKWSTPTDQVGGIDPFGNSLVQLENFLPAQHGKPDPCVPCPPSIPAGSLLSVSYFCIPRNDKLMGYWDTVADRLYKIRHCENIEGVERKLALFAPPIDPGLLVRAIAAGISIGDVLAQGAGETPNYRFQTLASKATELVQLVISLGNSLLQAIEKRDAEALSNLRSTHELTLSKLVREVKLQQVQESLHALAGLEATKRTTEARRNFYRDVKYTSGGEELALNLNEEGSRLETAALALNTAANIFHMLPNFKIGGWGFGGAPGTDAEWGGVNLGNAASAMGQFIGGLGSLKRAAAGGVGTQASYGRRWDEWKLQERLADLELAQMEHQIEAARIRVEINKAELRDHDKQIEQQQEVLAFMKDRKFSNQDLYDWMVGKISANYFQAWQMAYRFALRVERAFHFEFGEQADGTAVSYVRNDSWDSLHKGLLAGDRLLLDIKRMEVDYLDRNRRELELTKHISLVRLKPDAFWKLKRDGKCDFELPDWLFDLDYPGHYFRRIKSVSLSIPCVVGPYANVNCTLTLRKNRIRTKPEKAEGEADDKNLLLNFARIQSIATSSGQNDSGLFEVNFRDERFLPFEGAGAESTWTLELPKEDNRQIDRSTLTDVILHLKFTARDGGKRFQNLRRDEVSKYLTGGYPDGDKTTPIVQRLFLVKDEFPGEWHRFTNSTGANATLSLDGLKDRLPYFLPNLPKGNAAATVTMLMPEESDLGKFSLGEDSGPSWKGVTFGKWDFTYDKPTKPSELGLLVSVMMEEDNN
jgi:hypothetical protein